MIELDLLDLRILHLHDSHSSMQKGYKGIVMSQRLIRFLVLQFV